MCDALLKDTNKAEMRIIWTQCVNYEQFIDGKFLVLKNCIVYTNSMVAIQNKANK